MLCPEEGQGLSRSRGITQVGATFLATEDQYQRLQWSDWLFREAGVVGCFRLSLFLIGCPVNALYTEPTMPIKYKPPQLKPKQRLLISIYIFCVLTFFLCAMRFWKAFKQVKKNYELLDL